MGWFDFIESLALTLNCQATVLSLIAVLYRYSGPKFLIGNFTKLVDHFFWTREPFIVSLIISNRPIFHEIHPGLFQLSVDTNMHADINRLTYRTSR